ncbi:MAG: hypothetical protein HY549_03635 [Elusimicrobia bacterium]|nr:hypothetical protein [Elusimicrobiota bacterium]
MNKRDAIPAIILLVSWVLLHSSLWTKGVYFLGDLTVLFHPLHAYAGELLQRGQFPLWNPYSHLGYPFHAMLQSGVLAPGSMPFHLFPFPTAFKLHLFFHHSLGTLWAFLWLRRLGRYPAALGAALFSLSGFLAANVTQINWTATLCWWPAFMLFRRNPLPLGLCLALAFFSGYPPILAPAALIAFLSGSWTMRSLRRWLLASLIAAAVAAALLLPAFEFFAQSTRQSGLGLSDRLIPAVEPWQLAGLIRPLGEAFGSGEGLKYPRQSCYYVGLCVLLLAAQGLRRLDARKALSTCLLLAVSALILLGPHTSVSLWLWQHFPPLRYVRSPAHFAFLPLLALAALAALGITGRKWARWALLAMSLELLVYGRGMHPTVSESYYSDGGELARFLQRDAGGHRFAVSPRAAHWLRGQGADLQGRYRDFKHRLYGQSQLPYHISTVGGLGEALLLKGSYAVKDFLFSLKSPEAAKNYLPWLDGKFLATFSPPDRRMPWRTVLWPLIEIETPARAWFIPEGSTRALTGEFSRAAEISGAVPLDYESSREDRFRLLGYASGPGAAFVSNAFYPGWRVYKEREQLFPRRALGAFMALPVSPGPLRLDFVYRPLSFRLGVWITLGGLFGLLLKGLQLLRRSVASNFV